ncbi:MAG: two-component system response regulator CreB [Verrucomicrobiota bacterium]
MPIPILIIEDEPAIADTLLYALNAEGFAPIWKPDGVSGLDALRTSAPALVVLDVGLPDINGFELCKQIRAESSVPVLFLTARNSEIDRVVGLEIGGDDYLTKPFSPRELTARVKAILRRGPALHEPTAATTAPVQSNHNGYFGPATVDELRCRITWRGQVLDLTATEFRLLKTLLEQPGRVFTREQLLSSAWSEPEASLDRTVDAHIKTLRAKIRAVSPADDPIQTHRGLGYSLKDN